MTLAATVRCFCCAYLFMQIVTTTHAQELRFQSSAKQVALIELYTSEGCSSCPPAEAWLSQLKADPGLWTSFVPIAFHVDYWDNLGWRDRFAAEKFTARQRAYAVEWSGDSLYTPALPSTAANGADGLASAGFPRPTQKTSAFSPPKRGTRIGSQLRLNPRGKVARNGRCTSHCLAARFHQRLAPAKTTAAIYAMIL
jgi:hypothetical protein